MISVLVLDIDGVLTDGKVTLDVNGGEQKTLSYRDIDAVFHARRQGLRLVLLTGEASPLVNVIARRLEITDVYSGAKDKYLALSQISLDLAVGFEQICYVGDSPRDVEAVAAAGLGLVPADASPPVKAVANRLLEHSGGNGAVAEAVEIILDVRDDPVASD